LWQVIGYEWGGLEQRELQQALHVLSQTIEKLQTAEYELSPDERELAVFYLERVADLQSFFQVAQLALETVIGSGDPLDFEAVTKIEIR
jgi:hypothetical protein